MSEKKHLVFVYGTLMKGQWNNERLNGGLFVGKGLTVEKYKMTANGVPYVSERTPEVQIKGELYLIDDEAFARCDRLEGHPRVYRRKQIFVNDLDNGGRRVAWIYFNERTVGKPIPSGDFRIYRSEGESTSQLYKHYNGRKGTEQKRKRVTTQTPIFKQLNTPSHCWWCGNEIDEYEVSPDGEMHSRCFEKSMNN